MADSAPVVLPQTDTVAPAASEGAVAAGDSVAVAGGAGSPPAAEKAPTLSERAKFELQRKQERLALKARKTELAGIEARFNEKLAGMQGDVEATRKALAEKDAELEKLRSDPLSALDASARAEAIRRHAREGTPEGQSAEELRQIRESYAKLSKDFEEYRSAQSQAQREREEREQAAQSQAAQQSEARLFQNVTAALLSAKAEDGKAKYPHLLAECTAEEIAEEVALIHEAGKKAGRQYTFDQVADSLETGAKKLHESRKQRRESLLSPPPPQEGAKPGSSPANKTGQGSRVTTAAQNGSDARKRASPTTRKLTEAEADELALAEIRKSMAKDTAQSKRN
jgi:hypothetical protein